jgi:cysteine desulfurase
MNPTIYLDYQATTPVAPEVAATMQPWIEEQFANPHSPHRLGREAAAAVEVAREQVLAALHLRVPEDREGQSVGPSVSNSPDAHPSPAPPNVQAVEVSVGGRLYFTSGATEAANWGLKGAAARLPEGRRRIVALATEHACVLDSVEWLGRQRFEVELLPVGADGIVDLDLVKARVDGTTGIVAAMLVNNEIGVIQPVEAIGAIAREAGALLFCDAVQGFGRVPLPLAGCHMVALSAHKIHGPKGIGALWVRDGVALDPFMHGGGQEGGIRSGTLSPALCVGFGEAARLLGERAEEDRAHVEALWSLACAATGGWTINGSAETRYHGNLNLRREGIDAARLISEVRDVAFSAGSACASGSGRPSHVLEALGLSEREARLSIRLGFGRYTSAEELGAALGLIHDAAERQLKFAA